MRKNIKLSLVLSCISLALSISRSIVNNILDRVSLDLHDAHASIQAALEYPEKEYIPSLVHQMGVKNITDYVYKAVLNFGVEIISNLLAQMNNIKNSVFHRAAIHCIANIEGEPAEKAPAQVLTVDE